MNIHLRSRALKTASKLPVGDPKRKQILAVLERLARPTVDIGKTLETDKLRIHRYMDSVRIWDLANAGRRGKAVDIMAVYDLDAIKGNDLATAKFDRWLGGVAGGQTFEQAERGIKALLSELGRTMGYQPKVQITQDKGINIDPPQSVAKRLKYTLVDVPERVLQLDVKPSDVSIRETTHRLNSRGERQFYVSDTVVSNTRSRNETKALYNWIVENEAQLKRVKTLADVRGLLNREGIPYRTFDLD
jgi:hypothetical protein